MAIQIGTNEFIILIIFIVIGVAAITVGVMWVIMKNQCSVDTIPSKKKRGRTFIIYTNKPEIPVVQVETRKKRPTK